jgi:asparagine synthase (glutamine-hydrolysing)
LDGARLWRAPFSFALFPFALTGPPIVSAIAGYWGSPEAGKAEALCRRLLEAQRRYGTDDLSLRVRRGYAAGRCLFRTLDEDRFDRQPLADADGRFLLVADLRLDNRDELLADLGRAPGEGLELADSDILLHAWRRWEESTLDRLLGDYAFALWDERDHKLVLARDPLGERPLHYRIGEDHIAFASMPQALAGLGGGSAVDETRMARFVADFPPAGERSFFAGVRKVEPGHVLVAGRQGARTRRYWQPSFADRRAPSPADHADGLREQIDAAVRRRLRRARGAVGAHLSAGQDSSAVATSAAVQLRAAGVPLVAFTAAPRLGFDGPVPAGTIADESAIAAATAALHPNIEHVVLRPPFPPALGHLTEANRFAGQPTGHVLNGAWWAAINGAAQARGVSVMLTGEVGNFTLSAGLGLDELAELLRPGSLGRWWREAHALGGGRFRWASVLNASLRSWIPEPAYRALRKASGPRRADPEFVAPAYRRGSTADEAGRAWERLVGLSGKARRWAMLGLVDPGNFRKYSLARWGVEERDSTADRRLVEYCFSLPVEARLGGGVLRPALRGALASRVAPAVLDPPARGYQSADWHERVTAAEVRAFAAEAEKEAGGGIVDWDAVRCVAVEWPNAGSGDRTLIALYPMKLLRVLAAGRFAADVAAGGNG